MTILSAVFVLTTTAGATFGADAASVPADTQPTPAASSAEPTAGTPDPAPAAEPTATLDRAPSADPIVAAARSPQPPAVVSAASVVVAFARSHLHAAYRHDATGPTAFDCSGLMWRVFHEAGLSAKVTSRSARSIYLAYRRRGLASRSNPQVGDLIVWGGGSHVGVYVGKGYAISALVNGVRIHRVQAMFTPFTAYLHTHLAGIVKPAWELRLASHIQSLRHTTRSVFLRATADGAGTKLGTLRLGTRFVVLASRHDAAGRRWFQVLTFSGRIGWLPATSSAR